MSSFVKMQIKLTTLFCLFALSLTSFSQSQSVQITGTVTSFQKKLTNIHILNYRDGMGTVTNEEGKFLLQVQLGDTLLISSIQYKRIKVSIHKNHIDSKQINIHLIQAVNVLDELTLHELSGSLNKDIANTPADSIQKSFKLTFDKSILSKPFKPDDMEKSKPPNAQRLADPIQMNGVGGAVGFRNYALEREQRLKRTLNSKKNFPAVLIKKFSLTFFTVNLNLPEEKIHHFVSFCDDRDLITHFNKGNYLTLIEILLEERKNYIIRD